MPNQARQSANAFEKTITKVVSANYLLYLPEGYEDTDEKWPLLLFLHGAGERGGDLEKVKLHGPVKLVEQGKGLPFVVVSPQCPENRWWDVESLDALLDQIVATYRIDEDRVYRTGLSMGGFGTWALAIARPNRFAALAPICGGGAPRLTRHLAHIPAWVFHGAKAEVVPLSESQNMVEALKSFGGDVRLTVYPEAGHDSWTAAYDNPDLYAWFLSHRRGSQGERAHENAWGTPAAVVGNVPVLRSALGGRPLRRHQRQRPVVGQACRSQRATDRRALCHAWPRS
ncbi:MAG: hypothetical protein AUJ96_29865 [Armatimonadetes bacterium CG2_30_66_41]|nr:phospholipase [Armatimonadota bacterium]OIO93597.1 MAG: hypothetical protein AUJ96_29865 [Armatimonadetes bacterium CG2_30_66_41]NCO90452.1 phospholipase [Armatimonadota bacterium]NCP29602.1 phospholipase [Armatimonadota bacterium]NCQ30213.1 phospholipase [Armatimonadota bacterium]